MRISDLHPPKLFHWQPFDEAPMWRRCADCERQMLAHEVELVVHPDDNPDHPSGLCAVLCEKCARDWAFEVTGNPDSLLFPGGRKFP